MINFQSIINSVSDEKGDVIRITPRRSKTTPIPDVRRRRRLAFQALEAAVCGFEAAGLRCHMRNRSLVSLLTSWSRIIIFDGPDRAFPYLKSCFTAVRSGAVSGIVDDHYRSSHGVVVPRCWREIPRLKVIQITMISRALPKCTAAASAAALEKAISTFSTPCPVDTDPRVILKLSELVPSLDLPPSSYKGQRLPPSRSVYPVFGMSASSISTRKSHGRAGIIARAHKLQRSEATDAVRRRRPAAGRRVGPVKGFRTNILDLSQAQVVAEDSRDTVEVIRKYFPPSGDSFTSVVNELGFKARVVTKSHPLLVTDGHILRKLFFPHLSSRRFWSDSLGPTPRWLRFPAPRRKKRRFYSADLSKATDGLSHHTVGEFCRLSGVDPDLIYRNMTVDGHKLVRGIFMGLPMSWTILSFVHAAVCLSLGGVPSFFLKGDDLVAYWTQAEFDSYVELLATVGMPLNVAKTFTSEDAAIFCETFYKATQRFKRRNRWYVGLIAQPTISLRRFFPDRECSVASITAASSELCSDLATRFNRIVRLRFDHLLKLSKLFRLNPYLPNHLGGSGFLVPKPGAEILSAYDRCRINAIFGGVLRYDPSPDAPSGSFTKKVKNAFSSVRMVPVGSGIPCTHFDEVLSYATSAAAYKDAKVGIFPDKVTNKTLIREFRRISRDSRMGIDFPITYADANRISANMVPLRTSVLHFCKTCETDAAGRCLEGHHSPPP